MPRRLRLHLPGGFYHVTLRGNHQQNIFIAEGDRRLLNVIVARALEKFAARLHAYCWMSNHLHFLIEVGEEPLAGQMRQIAAEFARAMQRKLETTGHFFERRYHAVLVDIDSYLLELVRYIHLNPVRARLVGAAAEYPWCSHHAYVGARAEPWVTSDFVLRMFAAQRAPAVAAYRAFLESTELEPWEKQAFDSSIEVLGSDDFIAKLQPSTAMAVERQSLQKLIAEACRRFEFDRLALQSPVRDAYASKVRAWIAHQARSRRIASLAAVARELGRDESTLRQAMCAYPKEVE
jgi:REP element-mobilizing transposase RayT